MNIILQGPQGSGKGTQAELVVAKYGLKYFEAGKILRSIASSDNEYAEVVKKTLSGGELIPDEYMRLIAWDFINKAAKDTGFVFDGYPRSLSQYEHLQDMLRKFGQKLDAVINIGIPEEETIKRLSARRTCSKCGEIYNLTTKPPKGAVCDVCQGELVQRADDKPEAIKRRLQIYYSQTHPVFERAKQEGIGFEINGVQSIAQVFMDVEQVLDKISSL